jgi:organic radical activating enzyme
VKPSLRIVPDTLQFFANSPKAWFKFVISNKADLDEVLTLQKEFSIPASRILLMPEGRTSADLDQSAPAIAELCRTHGFRFCDRLHIRLWGDKRGV